MTDPSGVVLSAAALPDLLRRVHRDLEARRGELDEINVFPVADADTGSNLVATVRAAVEAVESSPADAGRAASRGALRGARGNSGVILSQLLRALAEAVEEGDVGARAFGAVLERSRGLAYEAVADPVEGTMLTVLTAAADGAGRAHPSGGLAAATGAAATAAAAAVARTPDQLPQLREAGVVDAGGRGLELTLRSLHGFVTGTGPLGGTGRRSRPAPQGTARPRVSRPGSDEGPPTASGRPGRRAAGAGAAGTGDRAPVVVPEAGTDAPGFEVQYLVDDAAGDGERLRDAAGRLRARLRRLGDSVVVVAADGLIHAHVHTDEVEAAVAAGRRHGRPEEVRVVALTEAGPAATRTPLGVVAALPDGEAAGVAADAGAVVLPAGGERPPAPGAVLRAVEEAGAAVVALLPGREDLLATARRVCRALPSGGPRLDLVESALSIPAVLAALAVLDPGADPDRAVADMRAAADGVSHAEVAAVGAAGPTPAGPARAGQLVARVAGEVRAVCDTPTAALEAVLRHAPASCEVLTLVLDADVGSRERQAVRRLADRLVPGAELTLVGGGSLPARYVVGLE